MYDIARIHKEMLIQFLSVQKLADKARVAASTVKRIFDTGTGNPETIGKLVIALELDPSEVVVVKEIIDLPKPLTEQAEKEVIESSRARAS